MASGPAQLLPPPPAPRLFARARRLKVEREEQRQALVDALEERRFRESNDLLRKRTSAAVAERIGLDRIAQLQVSCALLPCCAGSPPLTGNAAAPPPPLQEKQRMAEMDAERSVAEAREAAAQFEADGVRARAQAEARRRLVAEQMAFLDVQNAAKADLDGAWGGGRGIAASCRWVRRSRGVRTAQRTLALRSSHHHPPPPHPCSAQAAARHGRYGAHARRGQCCCSCVACS